MASTRKKTNYTGVYSRVHDSRRYKGKPDVCYDICYRLSGKRKLIWEKAGWSSEKITAAIASNLRAERIKQAKVGSLPTEAAKLTLSEIFERFRADYLEVSRKYPQDAVCIYKKRIEPLLGHLTLHEVTVAHVDGLKKSIQHLAPQSIKHTLALLGEVYRQAHKWGLYEGDIPSTKVKTPQSDNRRMRFLTKEEARTLLTVLQARSLDLWRMSLLALHTGMRAGEIFNLRWEHINFTERTISIKDGKGEQSRVAHMTDQAYDMLQVASIQATSQYRKLNGRLVFPKRGTDNEPRTETGSGFQGIVRDTGLNDGISDPRDKVVFHSLRHTFASWLVQEGVPLYTVQNLMGHKTIIMTQRYAHLAPDQGREAARVFSGLL